MNNVSPGAQRAFIEFMQRKAQALVTKDAGFFKEHLAEEFHYVNSAGTPFGKKGYIDYFVGNGKFKWISQELTKVMAMQHGDLLIGTCVTTDRFKYEGNPSRVSFRQIHILRRQGDSWTWVSGQSRTVRIL